MKLYHKPRQNLDFIHELPKIIEESVIDEAQSYAGRAVLVNPKYTSIVELTYNNADKKRLMTAYRSSSNKRNPFAQKVHGKQITTEPSHAAQSSRIDEHISSIGTATKTIARIAPKSQTPLMSAATEAARDDIANYTKIIDNRDLKSFGKTASGVSAIRYGKQINGCAIIVEEARTGGGNIAFFDMYKHKGTLTKDSLKLMKDRTNGGKGKPPTLAPAQSREGSATPAPTETIAQTAPKSQTPRRVWTF
jgi:hypothetical protein